MLSLSGEQQGAKPECAEGSSSPRFPARAGTSARASCRWAQQNRCCGSPLAVPAGREGLFYGPAALCGVPGRERENTRRGPAGAATHQRSSLVNPATNDTHYARESLLFSSVSYRFHSFQVFHFVCYQTCASLASWPPAGTLHRVTASPSVQAPCPLSAAVSALPVAGRVREVPGFDRAGRTGVAGRSAASGCRSGGGCASRRRAASGQRNGSGGIAEGGGRPGGVCRD